MNKKTKDRIPSILLVTGLTVLALTCLMGLSLVKAQTAPVIYWQFNNPTPLTPTTGGATFNITPGTTTYAIGTSGPVGNYLAQTQAAAATGMSAGSINPVAANAISVQFIFKPGVNFQTYIAGESSGGKANILFAGTTKIAFQYPYIIVTTKLNSGEVDNYFTLAGINKASWSTLQDGLWHMISFTFNATTGTRRLYIDGQSPAEFIVAGASGTISNSSASVELQSGIAEFQYDGLIDEIAIYYGAITAKQVWQNYIDFQAGNHYTTAEIGAVPAYQPSTAGIIPLDYGPGYVGTDLVSVSPIDQLKVFPRPRHMPIALGSDSFPKLLNCEDPVYLGGLTYVSNTQAYLNAVEIMLYYANNFNGVLDMWQIASGVYASDTTVFQGKMIKVKNANPQLKLQAVTVLPALGTDANIPHNSFPFCTTGEVFPSKFFLQNGVAQYTNQDGTACPNSLLPCPPGCGIGRQGRPGRPSNQANVYPDSGMLVPGNYNRDAVTLVDAALTGTNKIDYLWENGELFLRYIDAAMDADPIVNADRIASGLSRWSYQSYWRQRLEAVYFGQYIGAVPATTGTRLLEYQIDGNDGAFHEWSYMKQNMTPFRGKYLSNTDFYPRVPLRWFEAFGANHGLLWMRINQKREFAGGDSLKLDFVSHGWDIIESNNIAPAQWLGLLKILGAKGAVSYLPSVFSLGSPNPHSENYVWSLIMPSYAQAISTRGKDFIYNGVELAGDIPARSHVDPGVPAFQFNMGDFRAVCVVRKRASINHYMISTALERNANMIGNCEDSVNRSITLNGESLTMTVRQQGSVYIYDNTDPANKVFYQLDGWHENTHPYYWSKDFILQAEVNDNYVPAPLKTYQRAAAPAGDYVGSTTVVSYPATTLSFDSIRFNFTPVVADTFFVWVRMRSKTGVSTGVSISMNGGASKIINCVTSTTFYYYRYEGCTVNPSNIIYNILDASPQHISLLATSKDVEVDLVVLTQNNNAGYLEPPAPCSGVTATITASGATTFCQGGSVTLTSNTNFSYLWSTGATTRAITPTISGNYTVTVSNISGCTAVSAATTVTVNALPSVPTITPSGSITFCTGGSVTLTPPVSTAYLWSTGATTQTIAPSTSGSYRVTVSNAAGCTASSAITTVVVNTLPGTPSITPASAISFCIGGSVVLSSSISPSLYLWSTGATTRTITASSAATYRVTITDGNGCTASSATKIVNINAAPIIAAISPVSNVCPAITINLDTISVTNTGAAVSVRTYHNTLADAQADINPQSNTASTTKTYYTRFESDSGCYAVRTISVTINSCACVTPPTANAGPAQSICSGSTATLAGAIGGTATVGTWTTSGTGAFTPSATTLNATYTPSVADTVAGSVTLTLTTDNPAGAPCAAAVGQLLLTINAHPTVAVSASGPVTFCSGGSVILGASVNNTYLWSNSATTQTITVSASGVFTCTVTSAAGCTNVSLAKTVTVNTLPSVPVITPTTDTTFCAGSSVILTSSAATTYLWSNAKTTAAITASVSGSYIVTVTNAAGCTNSSVSMLVTVNALPSIPTISANGPISLCTGSTVTLTSSTATTYLWSTGASTQSIITGTAGPYIVTVTNAAGCTRSSVAMQVSAIQSPTIPAVSYTKSPILCLGDSILLQSSSASNNTWVPSGATTRSITARAAGDYAVIVTNAAGCTASSTAVTVSYINCTSTCTTPTRLTIGAITKAGATLGWDSTNVATDYIIFLTNNRTNVQTKITVQGNNHKWRVKNLQKGTSYGWYVQAVCGCCVFTDYSIKKTFTTLTE